MPVDRERLRQQLRDEEALRARHTLLQTEGLDPDAVGRAGEIARERGLPPLLVAEDLPGYERAVAMDRAHALAQRNPAIGSWLSDPQHAALARDDVGGMDALDRVMDALWRPVALTAAVLSPASAAAGVEVARGYGGPPAPSGVGVAPVSPGTEQSLPEQARDIGLSTRIAMRSGITGLAEAPVNAANWLLRSFTQPARWVAEQFDVETSVPVVRNPASEWLREATIRANAADEDRLSFRARALAANRPDTLLGTLGFYLRHPALIGTDLASAGGFMAAGGVVPGRKEATIAAMAVSQASASVEDAYRRLLEQGMDEDEARGQASSVFGPVAAIGLVAPRLVPGGQSFERLIGREAAEGVSRSARVALPLVGEPVSEGLEEGAVALATNLGVGDPAMQGVGAAAGMGFVAGAGMGGAAAGAGAFSREETDTLAERLGALSPEHLRRGNAALEPLAAAVADNDRLVALAEKVDALKIKARDRSAAEALLQRMADRSADVPSDLYVDARALAQVFQAAGEDPALRIGELVGREGALQEALVGTGDVRVPIGRFLTSDIRDRMMPLARVSPERLSNAELAEVSLDEVAEAYLGEAEPDGDVSRETPRALVEGQLAAQLEQQLGLDPSQARARAQAMAMAYERRAGRRADGTTAYDLFAADNLTFRRETPGALADQRAPVDVALDPYLDDVLARGTDPVEAAPGASLVQTVIDSGGIDPSSVGADDLRAAGVQQPGFFKVGGATVERMAEELSEQDSPFVDLFTTRDEFGRADYRELIELVGAELADRPALPAADEGFVGLRNQVAAAVRALGLRGVDTASLGRPALRRLVEEELGSGQYGQVAFHGTHARGVEQFSLQKIGTGEGAQAYGWGLYFASSREIAEWYRETVARRRLSLPTLTVRFGDETRSMSIGDGEFSAWLSQYGPPKPDGVSDVDWMDTVMEVAGFLEREIELTGEVPVPAWLDTPNVRAQMQGGYDLIVARAMIDRLRQGDVTVSLVKEFSYDTPEGRAQADGIELVVELGEQFSDGLDEDAEVGAVATWVVEAMKKPDPRSWMAAFGGHRTIGGVNVAAFPELAEAMLEHLESIGVRRERTGQLYEVDVPDSDDLLDWEAMISDQPPAVREKLEKALAALEVRLTTETMEGRGGTAKLSLLEGISRMLMDPDLMDGSDVYRRLSAGLGSQQAASHFLFEAGIPGLRYLDATSRHNRPPQRSHNFVIWDESRIQKTREFYQPADGGAPSYMSLAQVDADRRAVEARFGGEAFAVEADDVEQMVEDGDPLAGAAALHLYSAGDFRSLSEDRKSGAARALLQYVEAMPPSSFPSLYRVLGFDDPSFRDDLLKRLRAKRTGGLSLTDQPVMSFTSENPEGKTPAKHIGRDVAAQFGDHTLVVELTGPGGSPVTVGRDISPLYYGADVEGFSAQERVKPGIDVIVPAGVRYRYLGESTRPGTDGEPEVVVRLEVSPDDGPGTLFQSERPFRSALLDAVDNARGAPKKASAQEWLGWFSGAQRRGDFRKEELEWLGVEEWLQRQEGPVTREAVQEFVRANELVLEETTMGSAAAPLDLDNLPFQAQRHDPNAFGDRFAVTGPNGLVGWFPSADEAEAAVYDYSRGFLRTQGVNLPSLGNDFVVSRVTQQQADEQGLPNELVGEWALFDRDKDSARDQEPADFMASLPAGLSYARAVQAAIESTTGVVAAPEDLGMVPGDQAPYAGMTVPGGTGYRVMLLKMPMGQSPETLKAARDRAMADLRALDSDSPEWMAASDAVMRLDRQIREGGTGGDFTGGHFEPNTVAHIRFDERVDADGKRVLFVQEIQSDWHQKGRRYGYKDTAADQRGRDLEAEMNRLGGELVRLDRAAQELDDGPEYAALLEQNQAISARLQELAPQVAEAQRAANMHQGVPDAPFKTTWPELAMKRMVRYAAENGFDRVAWPTVDLVPQIEQWGMTLEQIKADPAASKRFGAILDRYETVVPRFMRKFGKAYGAQVVESTISGPPAEDSKFWDAFLKGLRKRLGPLGWNEQAISSVLSGSITAADDRGQVLGDPAGLEQVLLPLFAEYAQDEDTPEAKAAVEAALVGSLRDASEGSGPLAIPALEITDALREAALSGLPLFQRANASIQFAAEGVVVRLGENANLSSLHHEFGHLFLEWLMADAFVAGADPTLAEDLDTFLAWRGKTARVADGYDAVRAAIEREDHEAFAEGYETYLHEGRAPSLALADLFARFRSWMLAVYGALRSRRFPIPDEMRRVYDRLYASDAEAEQASEDSGFMPLPDNVAGLVGDVRWQSYQRKLQRARDETRARLDAAVVGPVMDEATKEWRSALSAMQERVLADAMDDPAHRARSILARGELPDGSEAATQVALDGAALKAEFGDTFVVERLRGLYRNEGGQPPALVADLLGFRSAFDLVDALANTPPIKVWVKQEADRRLRAEREDPVLDGSLPARALRAAHGSPRLAALEDELAMVAELGGQPAPPPRVLGALARRTVAGIPLRSLRPNDYLRAERSAATVAMRELSKARPNFAAALMAKRRQTMNAHLYRAALDRKHQAEKAYRYLGRFNTKAKRQKLGKVGGSYLEQIDALMEQLDLRPASGPEVRRRQSLLEFVAAAEKRGEAISVPPSLLDQARRTNVRELTGEQLQGIVDTIRQIDHLARTKGALLLLGEKRRLAEVDAANAESVRAAFGEQPPTSGDITAGERLRAMVENGLGQYLNASSLARDLDGEVEGGAVWASVVKPIQQANAETELALTEMTERVSAIYLKHYTRAELRGLRVAHIKAPDGSLWSRERILALAGNRGNPGNMAAIFGQRDVTMTPEVVDFLLAQMDARDWQLVLDLAGEFERLWPLVAAREKAKTGLVPERVEFHPFQVTTTDGQTLDLPGWYWPLVAETHPSRADQRSIGEELDDAFDAMKVGKTARAMTRNGSAIERVGFGGRVVRLDLGVVQSKLRESLRDIHLGPAVNAVDRVLKGRRLVRAAGLARKGQHLRALHQWLVDVAAGELGPQSVSEMAVRHFRTNASAALMGFKVSTALIQPTGFAQSLPVLGEKWMGVGLKRMAELDAGRVRGGSGSSGYVNEASPGMALRGRGHVEQVREVDRSLAGKRFDLQRHAWWLMARTQRVVDIATFLGAEAKGLELFDNDLEKARAYAFDVVERAQGSNDFVGKNALQRGSAGTKIRQSEWVKATTFMLSYMMAKGQQVYLRTAHSSFRDPSQMVRLTADLVHLFVWEVMALAVLRGGWPEDEDEDGTIFDEDLAAWLGKGVGQSVLGTIPGLAHLASSLRGYSPETTGVAAANAFGSLIRNAMDDDETVDKADVKALSTALGAAFGFPSSQTNVLIDALWAHAEGDETALRDFFVRPQESRTTADVLEDEFGVGAR